MKVYKCGTKAKFDKIDGTLAAIEISYSSVTYKFAYFDNEMNYKSVWVDKAEITVDNPEYETIGFYKSKKNNNG